MNRRSQRALSSRTYAWGYIEIDWFAHQSEEYRNEWMRYAWDWLRKNDTNGWFNAVREVFGQEPFPPNVVPTPEQKARLDTLFPHGDW
ncbi:MAG: hypothetical protein FJ225_10885 [Lentisphaerae bacterium]|nr:hypothetical protein [Lentisphaerota bacterium]